MKQLFPTILTLMIHCIYALPVYDNTERGSSRERIGRGKIGKRGRRRERGREGEFGKIFLLSFRFLKKLQTIYLCFRNVSGNCYTAFFDVWIIS